MPDPMTYHDAIYGPIQITEPVINDLIGSDAVQRLKGVLQHGISGLIGITAPITRYDHSLGVLCLVKCFGGSVEEQIAALLHDVSHTIFSHVIDYVFDGHDSQGYHDENKQAYVATTDLPAILASHGRDWRVYLNEASFPLLEQPSPRLCADRLDYFFRDSLPLKLATQEEIQFALRHLVVRRGRIAVESLEAAQWIGYTYMAADDASWANYREVGLYELTARAIRRAMQIGALEEADFWLTDRLVWSNLHACSDSELQSRLELVSADTHFAWDENDPTFRVSTKIRTIDPDVVNDGQLTPLSELDPVYADARRGYLARKHGKWPFRVLKLT
jgi:HD superfamily phosphohydrolase